jgi:hypothetical protein
MSAARITEKDVRLFLMDKPELNTLLRGVRFSPEEIEAAIVHCIDWFNQASPPTSASYTVETFPFRITLISGVTGHLLKGAAVHEASNNLTYSLDGLQVNDKDKAEIFTRLGLQFWEEFKESVLNIKLNQNIAAAFGSKFSEHIFTAH